MTGEPMLKRGHNDPHDWVVYAQKTLNYALAGGMHVDVPENGVFDQGFEQEVIAFQSQHGLGRDGVIGPHTWAALDKAVKAKQRAPAGSAAEQDDQLQSPPREVHSAPGHKDDEKFRQRTDSHGNTVRVYDVDAEEITGSRHPRASWDGVVSSMISMAETNSETQIRFVRDAVDEFQGSSRARIGEFAQAAERFREESHVHFPWGLLVDGLESGLKSVFEIPAEIGGWIFERVRDAFTSQLKSELEAQADPVPDLANRLEVGVAALAEHVKKQHTRAVDDVKAAIPDYIKDAMREYQQEPVSDNHDWISEMVAWFGFPAPAQETVTQPILYYLNQQFDAMIQQAQEELLHSG
jgi:hypothetical protein